MLESMRNAASGWLAKILIGFLVASFGAWGLSGVAGTTGKKKFAHVGKETLSVRAFQEKLAREIRLIEQKIGHPVTLEDAWSFGIVEQLLDRLLIEATLDNDANIRSLGTTEAAIAKSIIKEKSFKDAFGKFSRAHFRRTLKINGLSEKQYTDLIRNAHRRQQIIAAISTAGAVPGPLIEAVHRFRHEKRIIAYMTLSSDMIEPIAPPVDSLLLAFFEMRKEQFRAPEYRKFEFITLNQEKIAASIKTSDEELKAAYQSRKEMFRRRERREVEQILFENIDEAQTAAERIMNGTASFTDIARERKLGENDLSLGLLEQKNFVDPAVGDAAFSLAPNDVSSPITGKFGTSLLRLIRIESETKRTFKDVSDELQSILSLQAARKKIINIYEKVENERAFGTSLAEISKKFSLPYRIIKLVDSEGYDPEKNKVENIPLRKELLAMLFKAKLNTATNPLQLNDSGFLWFNVPEVIFSRDRTFEDVRDQVLVLWHKEEKRKRLGARAEKLLSQLRNGVDFEALSIENGESLTVTPPFKRNSSVRGLSAATIEHAFVTPLNGFAISKQKNETGRIIFQIRDIDVPRIIGDQKIEKTTSQWLKTSIRQDNFSTYIKNRQKEFNMIVNKEKLRKNLALNPAR